MCFVGTAEELVHIFVLKLFKDGVYKRSVWRELCAHYGLGFWNENDWSGDE